jgi:hypothetical protein
MLERLACAWRLFFRCRTLEFTRVRKRAKPAVARRVQRRVRPHFRCRQLRVEQWRSAPREPLDQCVCNGFGLIER